MSLGVLPVIDNVLSIADEHLLNLPCKWKPARQLQRRIPADSPIKAASA